MKKLPTLFLVVVFTVSGCAYNIVPKEDQLNMTGRYSELEKHMEKEIGQKKSVPTSKLWYLCTAYSRLKKYNKLFTCLERLDRNIAQGDTKWYFYDFSPGPHLLRAEAYIELGNYSGAVEEAQKAYDLVMEKKLTKYLLIQSLATLGLSHALNGDLKKGMEYAEELERVSTSYPHSTMTPDKYVGLTKIYVATKEYEKALDTIRRAESEAGFFALTNVITGTAISGEDMFTYIELPRNFMLNKCLFQVGKLQEAKKGFEAMLNNPKIRNNGDIHWMILYDRGRIAERENDLDLAISLYKHSVEIIEKQRETINTEAAKIGFVGDKQSVYRHLVAVLVEKGEHAEAFSYAERGKARALVDLLASKREFRRGETASRITAILEDLEEAEMSAVVQDDKVPPDQLSLNRGVIVNIKNRITVADPETASLVTVRPPDVRKIQELLPLGETLVEYFGSGDTFFAFIVNHDEVRGVKLEVKEMRQEIKVFRDNIMVPDSYQFKTGGQALYEKLIQPVEGMIGSKNLTIVPHGALHYLPFNALHDKNGFLIDRYNIRILPSASVMKFLKDRREGHAGNLLAFGNPDLGDPTYDLPGAQDEAIAITKDKPKSKLLLRKQATETAVKSFGEQFRYIHFATHGTFDAEKPLSSGLLLAGDSENDGMLTVGELYDLSLPADLVTLSACETALGKVANGDDVVGFTRGFLYAGVSSIVSSLWKVDDQATSILMQQFYESLKETDKRSALRIAQLKVKDTYNPHPYFWAAFQITGSVQ